MARKSQSEKFQSILESVKRIGKEGEELFSIFQRELNTLEMKSNQNVVVEIKKLKDSFESQLSKFCNEQLNGKKHLTLSSLSEMTVDKVVGQMSADNKSAKRVRVALTASELTQANKDWFDKNVLGKRKEKKEKRTSETVQREAKAIARQIAALQKKEDLLNKEVGRLVVEEDKAKHKDGTVGYVESDSSGRRQSSKEKAAAANKYEAMQGKK